MTRSRVALALTLLVVSATLAVLCLRAFGATMGDSGRYVAIAQNLASGNGFSSSPSAPYWPEVFRAPLYPAFLAGLLRAGVGLDRAAFVQFGLYALAAGLLWKTALGVHNDRLAADTLVVLLALHAPIIRWSVQVATEALTLPLVATAAFFLVRHLREPSWPSSVALGGVVGCLFLVRTDYVLLLIAIPAVSAATLRGTRKWRYTAALSLTVAAIALPWIGRNLATLPGVIRPLGIGGGMATWVRSVELSVPDPQERERLVHKDARIRTLHDFSEPALLLAADDSLSAEAVGRLKPRAPELLLGAIWKISFRNWVEHVDPRVGRSLALVAFCWSAALLAAAYLGAGLLLPHSTSARALLALVVPVAGVHALLITEARYTAPLRPVMVLFAAYGLVWVGRRIQATVHER